MQGMAEELISGRASAALRAVAAGCAVDEITAGVAAREVARALLPEMTGWRARRIRVNGRTYRARWVTTYRPYLQDSWARRDFNRSDEALLRGHASINHVLPAPSTLFSLIRPPRDEEVRTFLADAPALARAVAAQTGCPSAQSLAAALEI